jgi:hypothetical protein
MRDGRAAHPDREALCRARGQLHRGNGRCADDCASVIPASGEVIRRQRASPLARNNGTRSACVTQGPLRNRELASAPPRADHHTRRAARPENRIDDVAKSDDRGGYAGRLWVLRACRGCRPITMVLYSTERPRTSLRLRAVRRTVVSDSRNDNALLPVAWADALKILCAGHMLGLVSCGAALATSAANASAFYWLEIAAVLFALGIVSSLFAFVSTPSAGHSSLTGEQNNVPRARQLTIERLVITCVLTLSSAVTFFCGCATAFMGLLQS